MHRLYLSLLIILFGGLAYAGGGPTDFISYQGRLQDNSANANGDYEFKFDLWTIAATSELADTSTQTLTVTNGLFNADLPFADAFDKTDGVGNPVGYELEIGIRPSGSLDPFTVLPRQQLRNAPRAQIAERGSDTFVVGDADGGRIRVIDQTGAPGFLAEPDVSGSGTFLQLSATDGNLVYDASSAGGGPRLSLTGPGGSVVFEPGDAVDNNKVILPVGSISSAEIGNEAGAAGDANQYFSTFLPTSNVALASRTISCPTAGYIVAIGHAGLGSGITANTTFLSISTDGTTALNGIEAFHYVDGPDTVASTCTTSQIIPVSAGDTTVSLLARSNQPTTGYYTGNASLTLLFVPTAYGTTLRPTVDSPFDAAPMNAAPPVPGSPAVAPTLVEPAFDGVDAGVSALRAEIDALRAELEAIRREQAAANGR